VGKEHSLGQKNRIVADIALRNSLQDFGKSVLVQYDIPFFEVRPQPNEAPMVRDNVEWSFDGFRGLSDR
jgi:hypothetical protein